MIWPSLLILLGLRCISPVLASDDRICYNPDGSEASADIPCTSDATTWCCNRNDICMSNGLCYLQHDGGFALSRASCTDRTWNGDGCYQYCWKINPSSGFPIVAAAYNGSSTTYCCGTASYENGEVTCGFGTASVPAGTAIPGVAALAVSSSTASPASNTSSNSSSFGNCSNSRADSSDCSSHDTAIGAGVGVPLGAIAIASLAWAFWERRGRLKAAAQGPGMSASGPSHLGGHFTDAVPPVELANDTSVSELYNQKGYTPRN
ncbi:hypothetical protein AOR_1_1136194 [Paecilomyces variotii No. 5]|uniref:Mid2 domain-containing protein n=1 Tax=Byssochlamys spectabilis (strain No. 5 / NBRC 109023) TaxID=1356009 RepID=V5G017_BYSSN|nr:hypothetical protein AOR_1_1136194 [Paecilomyces variotii No. 5]